MDQEKIKNMIENVCRFQSQKLKRE